LVAQLNGMGGYLYYSVQVGTGEVLSFLHEDYGGCMHIEVRSLILFTTSRVDYLGKLSLGQTHRLFVISDLVGEVP